MVVYESNLMVITYAPETDSILVEWPSKEPYTLLEAKESTNILIEVLKNYDAKSLLIDAGNAKINVEFHEYLGVVNSLMNELSKSRVKKVARILTSDPGREAILASSMQSTNFNFQLQNFKSRAEALEWIAKN